MSNTNGYSIGIIGGGVSGISSLHRLLTILNRNAIECHAIHLFEEETHVGGPAWSDLNSEVQLFNFPAGVAALELNDYSGKFLKWCVQSGYTDVVFGSYPPRHLFGAYCADFLLVINLVHKTACNRWCFALLSLLYNAYFSLCCGVLIDPGNSNYGP